MSTRLTTTRTLAALATSGVLVLGLAACGGGDDTTDDASSSAQESTPADEDTATDDDAADDDAADDTATDDDAADASADGDFCGAFEELTGAQSELSSLDPSDPAAAAASFDELTSAMEAADAPDEVAADWDTVTGGFRGLTDAMQAAADDPSNTDTSGLMDSVNVLTSEEFTTATTNVATYAGQNC